MDDLEFLGEAPDDITPRSGFSNGALTFSHGAVNGTFDISYTIEKLDASGNKLGEYTWKATVNSSATSVEMEYNGGFKNHAGGGSTFKFDLTQSGGLAISVGAWATADDLGGGNRGGALGAWGSGKTATARFLTGLTNQGAGSPIGTTYAGTPARPGSEVYNTLDTAEFLNSPFSRDASGNNISATNRLIFSGFSGELPQYFASPLGRNVSCDVNISHSPENGKFLISIIAAGVEWNAHVDGSSTSFELINARGPLNGGSSLAFSTPNGQTLSEWASTIGAMGAHGSGKTITSSSGATFTEKGTGSRIGEDDPGDPTDPTDPGDPTNPTKPTAPKYSGGFVVQTGANAGDYLEINIDRMDSGTLGIDGSDISSRVSASAAITAVNAAINAVSTQRAELGALQNRLQHKMSNLDTSAENLSAAESRIRDIDMAKEMSNYTRWNILSQASTAMLAQANQAPQNVLQMLG